MLKIALPNKGRLADETRELFEDAGEWADDESVKDALASSESLGWLVSFVVSPDPTRLAPSAPYNAEVAAFRALQLVPGMGPVNARWTLDALAEAGGAIKSLSGIKVPSAVERDFKRLAALMEKAKERFPEDLDYVVSLDTTKAVTAGIEEIVKTLFEALILVIIVVFIFLQGFRTTLIPLLAVPVSLVGTFMLFPLLGFSINTLSLFGLVLAIGIVVDDAIVVVEAVEHHIEKGLSPREATLKAMSEVSGPVVAIALILTAVFLPTAFVPGITGRLYQQFAVTIAVSVLLSAFKALTLSPALASLLLRPRQEFRGPLGAFFRAFNRHFTRATEGYVTGCRILIGKSARSMLLLAGVAVLSLGIGSRLPGGFLPEEDQGYFYLAVQLPDAASLQRTDAVCREIEAILAKTPGVQSYNTVVAFSLLSTVYATLRMGEKFESIGIRPMS